MDSRTLDSMVAQFCRAREGSFFPGGPVRLIFDRLGMSRAADGRVDCTYHYRVEPQGPPQLVAPPPDPTPDYLAPGELHDRVRRAFQAGLDRQAAEIQERLRSEQAGARGPLGSAANPIDVTPPERDTATPPAIVDRRPGRQ